MYSETRNSVLFIASIQREGEEEGIYFYVILLGNTK